MALQKTNSELFLEQLIRKESPKQLLNWVNKTLETKLSRVEELCTGAAYCQLMDIISPNIIDLSTIHFFTNIKKDCRKNYKALEYAFETLNVDKVIPIHKLINFEFMPNIKFLVWFKEYFDYNYVSQKIHYPALLMRYFKPLGYGAPSDSDLVELMWKENERDIAPKSYLQKKLNKKQSRILIMDNIEQENQNIHQSEIYLERLKNERDFYLMKLKKIEALCIQSGDIGKFAIWVKNILHAKAKPN